MAFVSRPSCTSRCTLLLAALFCFVMVLIGYQDFVYTSTAGELDYDENVEYTIEDTTAVDQTSKEQIIFYSEGESPKENEVIELVTEPNEYDISSKEDATQADQAIPVQEAVMTTNSVRQGVAAMATSKPRSQVSEISSRFNTQKDNTSSDFGLILTYARSGSSWLGDLTGQAPDTFYVFEPFTGLIKEGYYYVGDTICFNNNTCRKSTKESETNRFMIQQMFYIYTCQLHKLDKLVLNSVHKKFHIAVNQDGYRACIRVHTESECISVLELNCRAASHRVIKVIRISMGLVSRMLILFPQLRVLQLIRDPRAVTNSRSNLTSIFKMAGNTDSQTLDMCKRTDYDLGIAKQLRSNHPERVNKVLYEDLVEQTNVMAKHVFDFLNLSKTPEVDKWLYESTHADLTKMKEQKFGTSRSDPIASANKWRESLAFKDVQYIDKTCAKVYSQLGYLPMKSEADQRNKTVPSRVQMIYT